MKSIYFDIPESIDVDDNEARIAFALGLYQRGKISIGEAAEIVGVSKRTIVELMGLEGIELINHPASDLERDLENARNYSR